LFAVKLRCKTLVLWKDKVTHYICCTYYNMRSNNVQSVEVVKIQVQKILKQLIYTTVYNTGIDDEFFNRKIFNTEQINIHTDALDAVAGCSL